MTPLDDFVAYILFHWPGWMAVNFVGPPSWRMQLSSQGTIIPLEIKLGQIYGPSMHIQGITTAERKWHARARQAGVVSGFFVGVKTNDGLWRAFLTEHSWSVISLVELLEMPQRQPWESIIADWLSHQRDVLYGKNGHSA